MKPQRLERINELLRQEISIIIQRDLKDPRIGFVSVLEVEASPDIREAKVYVSIFEEKKKADETLKGLESAAGFIRNEIRERLSLRHIPHITFKIDNSIERGSHVLDLMKKISSGEKIEDEPR